MIRQIIAGLVLSFAAFGCAVDVEPTEGVEDSTIAEAESALSGGVGDACGGFAGIQCDKGLFCDYAPETSCGSGDQMGVCREPPAACQWVYKPVCGCDGETYSNACVAAANSVSVLHQGECTRD